MAASNFAAALARVLRHEGGYSNHPKDPGGPTYKGVIQRVYDAYRKGKGLKTRSVKLLEDAELQEIYRRQYWDAARGDDLPPGIDYCVFDAAVNSGPVQAAKWLQRALGVADDGQVGAITIAAAKSCADTAGVIDDLCDRRLAMLKGLRTWPVFGRGWAARVADVRRDARAMARGEILAEVAGVAWADPTAKAAPADMALKEVAKTPEALAGALAAVSALANAASSPGPLQWALAAAVLAAVGIAAFAFIARRRNA